MEVVVAQMERVRVATQEVRVEVSGGVGEQAR